MLNKDPKSLREWFIKIRNIVDKNGIQPEDAYEFDETGFVWVSHQRKIWSLELNTTVDDRFYNQEITTGLL